MVPRDHDLRADRLRVLRHQRQVTVRRAAGDDLQLARVLEFLERGQQIALVLVVENVPAILQPVQVKPRQLVELVVTLRAVDFLVRQLDALVHRADITVLQQLVAQHRGQRRRDRHGQAEIAAVIQQPVHHVDQRDIRLRDRLVEPVLLKKLVVFGMPDKRQVGVQDQREITLWRHASRKVTAITGLVSSELVITVKNQLGRRARIA
jgi:hypothetical protein